MCTIEIEAMEFYAYHGHYEIEQIVGNRFLLDLRLEVDGDAARKSDNLKDAVNYQLVYQLIKDEMLKKSYLLENIAGRILDRLYRDVQGIQKATIKVRKMNPPMGGQIKSVSISMTK